MFCLGLGALSRSDHQNPTESTDRHDASDNEEVASDSLPLNHHALDWESLPYKSCKGYADSCLNSHHDLKGMFAVYDGHDKWSDVCRKSSAILSHKWSFPISKVNQKLQRLKPYNNDGDYNNDIEIRFTEDVCLLVPCHGNILAFTDRKFSVHIFGSSYRSLGTYRRWSRCRRIRISLVCELGPELRSNSDSWRYSAHSRTCKLREKLVPFGH